MEILDLRGKKGLIVGIANEESLTAWAAKHFHQAGADLAITYFNDKAKPFVEPIAQRVEIQGRLMDLYARLAKREEQDAIMQFGYAHRQYIQQVPAFIPHLSGKRAGGMEHQEKSTHG